MASETIYDHPLYYEILFGWDRGAEAEFYHLAFERAGVAAGARILEVGCGTGLVGRLLARRGWQVTGLDIRPGMLAFLEARAADEGLRMETLCADMTAFQSARPFAAACNPLSSFRLLASDTAAQAHLRRMAAALEPGGVYVLDMDLLASEGAPVLTTDESWEMTRGEITVRAENEAVHVSDAGVESVLAWGPGAHLRGYTASELERQVRAAGGFRIEAWHPESGRASGVSRFRIDDVATAPVVGRAMVVLSRTSLGAPPSTG